MLFLFPSNLLYTLPIPSTPFYLRCPYLFGISPPPPPLPLPHLGHITSASSDALAAAALQHQLVADEEAQNSSPTPTHVPAGVSTEHPMVLNSRSRDYTVGDPLGGGIHASDMGMEGYAGSAIASSSPRGGRYASSSSDSYHHNTIGGGGDFEGGNEWFDDGPTSDTHNLDPAMTARRVSRLIVLLQLFIRRFKHVPLQLITLQVHTSQANFNPNSNCYSNTNSNCLSVSLLSDEKTYLTSTPPSLLPLLFLKVLAGRDDTPVLTLTLRATDTVGLLRTKVAQHFKENSDVISLTKLARTGTGASPSMLLGLGGTNMGERLDRDDLTLRQAKFSPTDAVIARKREAIPPPPGRITHSIMHFSKDRLVNPFSTYPHHSHLLSLHVPPPPLLPLPTLTPSTHILHLQVQLLQHPPDQQTPVA